MTELFSKSLDFWGLNATFHLIRLVVLLVILYMQWGQWRESRQTGYRIAFIAFVVITATELFIAYFYTASVLQNVAPPISRHPLGSDFLQSLSLALFAFSTPYLLISEARKIRWNTPALWTVFLLLLALLALFRFVPAAVALGQSVHSENALLSLFAVGFLTWALVMVARLPQGRNGQVLASLSFLIVSQILHFGYFSGVTLSWLPLHYGERIFSTFGYITYLGFLHDHILAEKRRLVEELRQSNAELRRQDVLKNRFLSLVSHELRTPLTAMHTAASLLQRKSLTGKEHEMLAGVISRRSQSMAAQVEELLDVSRIQLDKLEYRAQPVDIHELLRNACDEMRLLCKEKNIALTLESAANGLIVSGDPNRLSQVLHNLIGNSIKFTPPGGSIIVRCHEEADMVSISVADTGVGIEAERLPHIFELFYHQGDDLRSGGVGLGLFIARSIIEAHGGAISVVSNPGRGTTFTFQLKKNISNRAGGIN